MSVVDEILKANEEYYKHFVGGLLPPHPSRHLAVLTCIDPRLDVNAMLGLKPGDAHICRNAGGLVTEDMLRTLILSYYLMGTKEFMIIGHTDCGTMNVRDEDVAGKLQRASGTAVVSPTSFLGFTDLEETVKHQVQKLHSHPWIPRDFPIRGFIYDVRTGRLDEMQAR